LGNENVEQAPWSREVTRHHLTLTFYDFFKKDWDIVIIGINVFNALQKLANGTKKKQLNKCLKTLIKAKI
jgi:hypothetical protein